MSSDRYATVLTEKEDNQRIRYIANKHIFQTFKTSAVSDPYFLSNIVGINENNNILTITNGWVGVGTTTQTAANLFQVTNMFNNNLLSVNQSGVGINTSSPNADIFALSVFGSSYYSGDVGIGTTMPTEKLRVEGNVQAYIFKARGADYAEWEVLDENEKTIPKSGEVVGFNTQGKITTNYSDSVHFGVVSLKPSIIGNEEILEANKKCVPVVYMGKIRMELDNENIQIGDYLIPILGNNNSITIDIKSPGSLTFKEYLTSIGYIHRFIEKRIYEIIIRM